jgi:putative glutamine amidotransferase
MTRPLIGITPNVRPAGKKGSEHVVLTAYVTMVSQAGALPVIVPAVTNRDEAREVLARLDGLLLTGGRDIDPGLYGQSPRHPDRVATPERVASDLAYARAAIDADLPALGVCLGIQIMNVADGGTLFQHLPEDLPGSLEHEDDDEGNSPDHDAMIEPGTKLFTLLGVERAHVNSYHHQAIAQVAPGWRLAARAPDGVVEAIERPDRYFCLGVQWHPERMLGSEVTRRLAGALADAARGAQSPSSRSASGSP